MKDADGRERTERTAGLLIRRACERDFPAIGELMADLDLAYATMDLSCFWVAEKDGEVVSAAELKDMRDCSLLSCVGVREDLQGSGIGKAVVAEVVRHARHAVYLYTLVPDFFRKAGFVDAASTPAGLPPRSSYGCEECDPRLCRCLMRPRDGS